MRAKLAGVLMVMCGLMVAAVPAFAHHGFSVEFDASKCMNLHGTLSGVDWENPHAYFRMDVKDADGKTNTWTMEMITPNALSRNGTTKQDFLDNMGKPMDARICPAKAGMSVHRGASEFIRMADGVFRITGQWVERARRGPLTPDKLHF